MNPELRRNLWLQFSPLRLIVAPVAVIIVLLLVWLVSDNSYALVAHAAEWYFLIIILFWGTRRAADLVAEEVAGGTWDGQRMSALGAWQMTWGKFIGGISYVWYSGIIAFMARLWAQSAGGLQPWHGEAGAQNLYLLGVGMFGQSVAFLTSLVLLRKQVVRRRLGVTLSQFAGLAAAAVMPGHLDINIFFNALPDIDWYGQIYPGPFFAIVTLAVFLVWSLFGSYRLMRIELQFRCMPWAWLGFALFLAVYADGLLYVAIKSADNAFAAWFSMPFALAYAMTYAALFLEPKDVVRYRALAAAASTGRLVRAVTLLPQWLPIFIAAAILGLCLTLFGGFDRLTRLSDYSGAGSTLLDLRSAVTLATLPLAVAVYLLRDVLFVLYLNFVSRRGRTDLMAAICLGIVYFPAYGVLVSLNAGLLVPFLAPYPPASPLLSIGAPGIESLILATLVLRRIRGAGEFRPVAA